MAYEYTDAEKLVQRVIARDTGAPLPDNILNAPLRLAPPPIVSDGPVYCANNCKSKGGARTRGCQTCIELKCRTCCMDAASEAQHNNRPRGPCKTHKVASISDVPIVEENPPLPLPLPIQTPPIRQPPYIPITPPSTQPRTVVPAAPRPTHHAPIPIQAAPSQSDLTQPGFSQPVPAQHISRTGRRQPLAQPIGPNWLQKKSEADNEKANMEAVKMRRLQMDEISKRTVELLVYYEVSY